MARVWLAALLLVLGVCQDSAAPTGADGVGASGATPSARQDAPDTVQLRSGERLTGRVEAIDESGVTLGGGARVARDDVEWIAYGAEEPPEELPYRDPEDVVVLIDGQLHLGYVILADRRHLVLEHYDGATRAIPFDQLAAVAFCTAPCVTAATPPEEPPIEEPPIGGTPSEEPPSGQAQAGEGPSPGGAGMPGGVPPWFEPGAPCADERPTTYCNWDLKVPGVCTFTVQGCGLGISITRPGREAYPGGENPCYGIAGIQSCSGLGSGRELFANFCCDRLQRARREGLSFPCSPDVDIDCDGVPNDLDDFPLDTERSSVGGATPRFERLVRIELGALRRPPWLDGDCASTWADGPQGWQQLAWALL